MKSNSPPSTPIVRRPLAVDLARSPSPLDRWLWCLHCERFFQVRHLRFDLLRIERCPFDDCIGAGLDQDLFLWDDWRQPGDPRWPDDESELELGMRSPEIASISDSTEEIESLARQFERSDQLRAIGAPELGARWTREILRVLDWWGIDVAEIELEQLAELLGEFPGWIPCAPWDAGDIARELTAFFRWLSQRSTGAEECARYLSDPCVQLELGRVIRKHRRRHR
jgi:hypothetical protein